MVRLFFDGFGTGASAPRADAEVGSGGVTSSATTLPLSAALTCRTGEALPTIASPDYVPITFVDSAGKLIETAYITAYTSGATSATIERGKEGTTGTAHAAGIVIKHGLLAADATSNLDNLARYNTVRGQPLASAADSEFATDGTGTPADLTGVNLSTSGVSVKDGVLNFEPVYAASGNNEQHRMLVKAIASESSWRLEARMYCAFEGTTWSRAAIVMRESSSGKYIQFGHGFDGVVARRLHLNSWSNTNTFSSAQRELSNPVSVYDYFAIRKNSATSYDFLVSQDGHSWTEWFKGYNPSGFATFDQYGVLAANMDSDQAGQVSVHWMRFR